MQGAVIWGKDEAADREAGRSWNEHLMKARAKGKRVIADVLWRHRSAETQFGTIEKFLDGVNVADLYAITIGEENIFWKGYHELLTGFYHRIKQKYPDLPVYQWYPNTFRATDWPGFMWPWLPADGWVIDEYWAEPRDFELAVRRHRMLGLPLVQLAWATPAIPRIPFHQALFQGQLRVAQKYNVPCAFFCWEEKTRLWAWDEKAQVYDLLGGRLHDRSVGYATGCISHYPWSDLLAKFDLYREAGFVGAKVAAGWVNLHNGECSRGRSSQAWADMEAEKLEAVRAHVGTDFIVCLNGHMSNVEEADEAVWDVGIAKAVLCALEPYDLFFFEEPRHYNGRPGYAELCASTAVPVAGGECLTTREEFEQYASARAFDIAQPDASYIGTGPFFDVAAMFAAQKKRVATHAWSSGVGVMQNIHAAFATPNVAILELPPLAGPLHTEVYADGYRFEGGYILPPEAPGLGVRLTDDFQNKHPFVPGSGEWNTVPGKPAPM